jgi:thioredoxin 1
MNPNLIIYCGIGAAIGATCGLLARRLTTWSFLPKNISRGALGGAGIALMLVLLMGGGESSAAMDSSTSNVKAIGEKDFATEVLQPKTPVLVDFYATWCGPCRMLSPRVDKVAQELSPKIKFVKVNVDNAPNLAQQYDISSIPALFLFKDGAVVKKIVGLQSEEELRANLTSQSPVSGR